MATKEHREVDVIRDLLVDLDGSAGSRELLHYAIGLADRFSACLTGLHVLPPAELPPVYKAGQLGEAIRLLRGDLDALSKAAERMFELETGGVLHKQWRTREGNVARVLSHVAAFSDLVVIGQRRWEGDPIHHPFPIAADIAIHCGRPVLVVPDHTNQFVCDRVIIAWDASREAVRAVHDALPLIALAKEVVIETAAEHGVEADAGDLIVHLGHHGIESRLVAEPANSSKSDRKVLDLLFRDPDCDLLVMGAYGHSKWREFLVGGVTQDALLTARVPVLMSH